jgi:hypothetical protein
MKPTPFPQLLHAFFHDWLVQQRNVSHHTVLSYRDSWREDGVGSVRTTGVRAISASSIACNALKS